MFAGIISDLFPGIARPNINYGALMKSLKLNTELNGLQPVEFFLRKNIQLFETIVVRHGLMVVGPTGAGKSMNIKVLSDSLSMLKATGHGDSHFLYEKVQHYTMNPKSVTMGQLYGEFDPNTREFIDGILPCLYRKAAEDTTPDRKFVVFDGPVDAIWIENMNTVLDDNQKLCLNSGEMLQMSSTMTMMFEVNDLSQASPATVSRCGMVFMEPSSLGLDPLVRSWMATMPAAATPLTKVTLMTLFDTFLQPGLQIVRRFCKVLQSPMGWGVGAWEALHARPCACGSCSLGVLLLVLLLVLGLVLHALLTNSWSSRLAKSSLLRYPRKWFPQLIRIFAKVYAVSSTLSLPRSTSARGLKARRLRRSLPWNSTSSPSSSLRSCGR